MSTAPRPSDSFKGPPVEETTSSTAETNVTEERIGTMRQQFIRVAFGLVGLAVFFVVARKTSEVIQTSIGMNEAKAVAKKLGNNDSGKAWSPEVSPQENLQNDLGTVQLDDKGMKCSVWVDRMSRGTIQGKKTFSEKMTVVFIDDDDKSVIVTCELKPTPQPDGTSRGLPVFAISLSFLPGQLPGEDTRSPVEELQKVTKPILDSVSPACPLPGDFEKLEIDGPNLPGVIKSFLAAAIKEAGAKLER